MRIRPANDIIAQYLASLLNSSLGKRLIQKIMIEGTRARVSLTEFKCLQVPKPTHNEQQLIADRITATHQSLHALTIEVSKLRAQKHGLMHDLLTGRVRVTVPEAATT